MLLFACICLKSLEGEQRSCSSDYRHVQGTGKGGGSLCHVPGVFEWLLIGENDKQRLERKSTGSWGKFPESVSRTGK